MRNKNLNDKVDFVLKPAIISITGDDVKRHIDDSSSPLSLAIGATPTHDGSGCVFELRLSNKGGTPVRVGKLELLFPLAKLFGDDSGEYRFYKEGLTVVGVASSRSKDDCDFELDPNFLRFTVSDPSGYSWSRKGVFAAEQVGVARNTRSGKCALVGFVTCEDFFCRVVMDMGAAELTAVVDMENVVLKPGAEIVLEKLMVATGDDAEALLGQYTRETGGRMHARIQPTIPTGWCSYYYYYGQETEDDILENARFLSRQRDAMPIEYIQIDDGWQRARGEWTESHATKFPHGMPWLATEIKKLGFKPGIWVAPFLVNPDTMVYRQHQEWLLRNQTGELLTMGGEYFLDATHPDALQWLAECFKTMKSWGYQYFKLDFMMVESCDGARYHDKAATRAQACRRGLQAIRAAVGDDAYILGGTVLTAPSVGLVDGCRVSTDVTPYWSLKGCTPESPAIPNVCRNIINRGYMHKNVWLNDPDCLIVREYHNREKYKHTPSLTLAEVRMLATAMLMSGGSLFLGDRMEKLSKERLKIIRTVFELMDGTAACPIDRMDSEVPRVWFRRGEPSLLGLFNWSDTPDNVAVPRAGVGLSATASFICEEVWTGKRVSWNAELSSFVTTLEPHSCGLFSISAI